MRTSLFSVCAILSLNALLSLTAHAQMPVPLSEIENSDISRLAGENTGIITLREPLDDAMQAVWPDSRSDPAPSQDASTSGSSAATQTDPETSTPPSTGVPAVFPVPLDAQRQEMAPKVALAPPSVHLSLRPGSARLASTLVEFARANGWEIAWEIDNDFPIDYRADFNGSFLDVITQVVESLRATDAPIRAKVYHGNKVVRIIHATR